MQKFTELSVLFSSANNGKTLKRISERTQYLIPYNMFEVVYALSTLNVFNSCIPDINADLAECKAYLKQFEL